MKQSLTLPINLNCSSVSSPNAGMMNVKLQRVLADISAQRDRSIAKIKDLQDEKLVLIEKVTDLEKFESSYNNAMRELESVRTALESSERIRTQQKDLIKLLQEEGATSNSNNNTRQNRFDSGNTMSSDFSLLEGTRNNNSISESRNGRRRSTSYSSTTSSSAGTGGGRRKSLSTSSTASSPSPRGKLRKHLLSSSSASSSNSPSFDGVQHRIPTGTSSQQQQQRRRTLSSPAAASSSPGLYHSSTSSSRGGRRLYPKTGFVKNPKPVLFVVLTFFKTGHFSESKTVLTLLITALSGFDICSEPDFLEYPENWFYCSKPVLRFENCFLFYLFLDRHSLGNASLVSIKLLSIAIPLFALSLSSR
jgi:hypothetical protein